MCQSLPDTTGNAKFKHAVDLFGAHDDSGELLERSRLELLDILRVNPRHAPAIAYLGLIALEAGNAQQADSFFTASLAIDSACAEAHAGRAQAFRAKHEWGKGLEEARLGVKLAPNSPVILWELCGELLFSAESTITDRRANEALPYLLRLISMNNDDRQAHLELAKLYERANQMADAVPHYREVLRIGQTDEDSDVWVYTVHLDVARCLEADKKYADAAAELQKYLAQIKEYGASGDEVSKIEKQIEELRRR